MAKPPVGFVSLSCPLCCPQHRGGAVPPSHVPLVCKGSVPLGVCSLWQLWGQRPGTQPLNSIPATPGISPLLPVLGVAQEAPGLTARRWNPAAVAWNPFPSRMATHRLDYRPRIPFFSKSTHFPFLDRSCPSWLTGGTDVSQCLGGGAPPRTVQSGQGPGTGTRPTQAEADLEPWQGPPPPLGRARPRGSQRGSRRQGGTGAHSR